MSYLDFADTPDDELLELIRSGKLPPGELTNAAQACGLIAGRASEVDDALIPLLDHASALVREGAVLGLELQGISQRARDKLLTMQDDPSVGVRSIVRDVLDDLALDA